MAKLFGPRLGLLVDAADGEAWYAELCALLRGIDALVMASVKDRTLTTPPSSPQNGDCYLIPSGNWGTGSNKANQIARWYTSAVVPAGAWEFFTPKKGWVVRVENETDSGGTCKRYQYTGTAWSEELGGGGGGGTVATGTISGGVLNLSAATADTIRVALNANITTLTLPAGAAGARKDLLIEFTHDNTSNVYTVSSGSIVWDVAPTPITQTSGARSYWMLSNVDNQGWLGFSGISPGVYDSLLTPVIATNVLTVDLSVPAWHRVTLNQNVTTINFANVPSGKVPVFALEFVQDATGGRTVTWPATVTADDGGSLPPLNTAAGASTVYTLSTVDGTNYKVYGGLENGGTINGNITVSGAARRFLADFTDASASNRLIFQTSVANGTTSLAAAPNGTGQVTLINTYNNSDVGNASQVYFGVTASEGRLVSGQVGSGSFLPMAMYAGGAMRMRLDTDGGVVMPSTGQRIKGDMSAATPADRLMLQNSVANQISVLGVIPSGTGAGGYIQAFNASDASNAAYISAEVTTTGARILSGKVGSGTAQNLGLEVISSGASPGTAQGIRLTTALEFRPTLDNQFNLGLASFRWKEVFAGVGAINTSDAREKDANQDDWTVRPLTSAEISAAQDLAKEIGGFKFLRAIAEKGDAARTHIGMTVQRAIAVMQSHGLDPMSYGFICYDEWEEQTTTTPAVIGTVPLPRQPLVDANGEVVLDENGEPILSDQEHEEVELEPEVVHVRPAGSLYGFRNDQLTLFMLAGLEARQEEILQRLAALEGVA